MTYRGPSTANSKEKRAIRPGRMLSHGREILQEKGLEKGKIGVEKGWVSNNHPGIPARKHLPDATIIDADNTWYDSRAIKMPWEIEQLRTAAIVTEKGMASAILIIKEGTTQKEIVKAFKKEIAADDRATGILFLMARIGSHFAPRQFPTDERAQMGDVISFDIGIDCYGYASDMARTFSLGKPNERLKKIYPVISAGYQHALNMIRPGTKMCDVFQSTMAYIHETGIPNYNRGNLGHQIGVKPTGQEPPLISPAETRPLEPGMVIVLRRLIMTNGVGAISIEDMIVITDDGYEILTKSSKELVEL